MKKCPYCAEKIQDNAKKCRWCGEWFDRTTKNRCYARIKNYEDYYWDSFSRAFDFFEPKESSQILLKGENSNTIVSGVGIFNSELKEFISWEEIRSISSFDISEIKKFGFIKGVRISTYICLDNLDRNFFIDCDCKIDSPYFIYALNGISWILKKSYKHIRKKFFIDLQENAFFQIGDNKLFSNRDIEVYHYESESSTDPYGPLVYNAPKLYEEDPDVVKHKYSKNWYLKGAVNTFDYWLDIIDSRNNSVITSVIGDTGYTHPLILDYLTQKYGAIEIDFEKEKELNSDIVKLPS